MENGNVWWGICAHDACTPYAAGGPCFSPCSISDLSSVVPQTVAGQVLPYKTPTRFTLCTRRRNQPLCAVLYPGARGIGDHTANQAPRKQHTLKAYAGCPYKVNQLGGAQPAVLGFALLREYTRPTTAARLCLSPAALQCATSLRLTRMDVVQ